MTLNEQELYYTKRRASATRDRNLVLIHGAGGTHLDWPPQMRHLPEADVYAIDLPGHGRSLGSGRAQISDYADDVVAFVEALDLRNVVLVGHSMGGAIAMTVSLQQHPSLDGLVLVGTGARLRVSGAILDRVNSDFIGTVEFITEFAWARGCSNELKATGREQLLKVEPSVLDGDFRACDAFDIMDQLSAIKIPVLVICGTSDNMTPLKYGRYLAEHIPQAHLVIVEDGGHMMALEQPDVVASAVAAFLLGIDQ